MSSSPASTITSASPSFWQVMPMRAQFDLAMCEGRHLVGLDVRAQPQTVVVAVGLHFRQVVLDPVQVDHRNRGFQILDAHPRLLNQVGSTATQSISTRMPTSWHPIVVRAGGSAAKNSW